MEKENLNELAKRMKALSGIQEGDKKFLNNESFSESSEEPESSQDEPEINESNFIIMEFPQKDVEPGNDDEKLYSLKK